MGCGKKFCSKTEANDGKCQSGIPGTKGDEGRISWVTGGEEERWEIPVVLPVLSVCTVG